MEAFELFLRFGFWLLLSSQCINAYIKFTILELPNFLPEETEILINADQYKDLTLVCTSNNPIAFIYNFELDDLRDTYMKKTNQYLHRNSPDLWTKDTYVFKGYLQTKIYYLVNMGIVFCKNLQLSDGNWITFLKSTENKGMIQVKRNQFPSNPILYSSQTFLATQLPLPWATFWQQSISNPFLPASESSDSDAPCSYQFEYIMNPTTQLTKWRCRDLTTENHELKRIKFAYCYSRFSCMNLRLQDQMKTVCISRLEDNDTCAGCSEPHSDVTKLKQYHPQVAFCDAKSALRYFYLFPNEVPTFRLDVGVIDYLQNIRTQLVRLVKPSSHAMFKRNEDVDVECHVDQFYLSSGSRIAIEVNGIYEFVPEGNYDRYKRNSTTNYKIVKESVRMTRSGTAVIHCFGPVADSFQWISVSLVVTVLGEEYKKSNEEDIYRQNLTRIRQKWEDSLVERDKEKVPKTLIGLIAGIMTIVIIIVIIFFSWRLRRYRNQVSKLTSQDIKNFEEGTGYSDTTDDNHVDCLPYNSQYEVPKSQIKIDKNSLLGSGAYGTVAKGVVWIRNELKEIAVKTIRPGADVMYLKALLSELKVMAYLGNGHDNILHLVAATTRNMDKEEVLVGVELCEMSLLEAIRQRSKGFVNFVKNGAFEPPTPTAYENVGPAHRYFSTVDLVNWSHQIADGMDYIASKRVVHGDLSLRNVLLTASQSAKICDFGLARQMVDYNYIKSEQCPLPWKWMAIETLAERTFSTSSDVWSFGITLWEIFSLGQEPYAGLTWTPNFVEQLRNGLRLNKPQFATDEIYNVMVHLWEIQPTDRPTFEPLKNIFSKFHREMSKYLKESGD